MPGRSLASIARLSQRDAETFPEFTQELEAIADVLRAFVLRAPPNLVESFGAAAIRETFNALASANILRQLSLKQSRDLLDLFTRSAGEMLDERFESDLVKALFGFDAIVGNYASPYAAGSAYVMLHHAFGEVNGKKGVWGHAIGGMGAITLAMARSAQKRCSSRLTFETKTRCATCWIKWSSVSGAWILPSITLGRKALPAL